MKLAKRPVHTYTDYPSSQRVRYKLNKRVILSVRYIVVNVHHNFLPKYDDIITIFMATFALLKLNTWTKVIWTNILLSCGGAPLLMISTHINALAV